MALATDTIAYTSVMLRDARQALDETTKENFSLEEKHNLLERQYALTMHKCNLATQLAEEQQKKIVDLQNKEDALALANRNLQAQVEFLRLQATATPFPFPNSLPSSYNFNSNFDTFMSNDPLRRSTIDKNDKNTKTNNDKRNSFTSWGSQSTPVPKGMSEKRNSTSVVTTKPSTPTTPTSPTSPRYFVPNSVPNPSPFANSNLNPSSNSPPYENHPHMTRTPSEPMIINGTENSNEGITPREVHVLPPMEKFDADPNAANANALTAYALQAQATHARAQALKASGSTSLLSSSLNVSANASSSNLSISVPNASASASNFATNGAPAQSDSLEIRQRSVLTSSDQSGVHPGADLSRFNSMPSISKFLTGNSFTTKMILSGRPIEAHQELNCATFHISGELLATGGGDHCVKIWDTSNHGGVPVYKKSLQEATSSMLSVHFSPMANLLCGTSNDKNSYVWDPIGREIHTLSGHTEKVTCATFLVEQQLASCSWDRHVKLFDLNRGFCTESFPLGSRMNSMCIGPFNFTICTAHVDKTIRVFDYRNGNTMHTVDAHSAAVTGVCSYPDNPTNVVTSSKDNTLKLIDLRTLEVVHTYKNSEYKNQRDINLICFSPNGQFIVAGGDEGKIVFWNTQTTKLENVITCSPKSSKGVTCVTWNPKRNQLIACHDNSLYLYDGEVVMT